ncbi:MAG: hypothetical protein IIA85_00365 [Nanoarchaeota archaeon]|nr:hypothetical protein [Nanoarchaeota archaeon]
MKRGLIITLPKSDIVTEYLSVFSKQIIDVCKEKSVKFKPLEKNHANKKEFEKLLKSIDYKLIILNGHGSPNVIQGHKNKELIKVGDNEEILSERITYARSCWAVLGVGNESMKHNKEGCFIGYDIPFMFLIDINHSANPIKDQTAKIFFETSNLVPIGLIKNHSAIESHENSKKSMLKAINKALKKKDKDSQAIAEVLWNNYLGQKIVGNVDARF